MYVCLCACVCNHLGNDLFLCDWLEDVSERSVASEPVGLQGTTLQLYNKYTTILTHTHVNLMRKSPMQQMIVRY